MKPDKSNAILNLPNRPEPRSKSLVANTESANPICVVLSAERPGKPGFIVSAVDQRRESPFHWPQVLYRQVVEGMRTGHLRDVPPFGFTNQEWLFNLEKGVQRSNGLNPLNPDQRAEAASIVEHEINGHLAQVRIHDPAFTNALRGYYIETHHNNEAVATAATG